MKNKRIFQKLGDKYQEIEKWMPSQVRNRKVDARLGEIQEVTEKDKRSTGRPGSRADTFALIGPRHPLLMP